MSSPWRQPFRRSKPAMASVALVGLVLLTSLSQADTALPADGEALPVEMASGSEINFWADAAPLSLVIRQLAELSGRSVEVEAPEENEENAGIVKFADILISGRFSGPLNSTLAKLSEDHPVVFDLDGKTLRAMSGDARSDISIDILGHALDEKFKSELLASAGAGNKVEFRDDAVRVSGHPAFVDRLLASIVEAKNRLEADVLTETTEASSPDAMSIADSGSTEVLVDIQDETKPPAEQANLSKPIRWVTDIPGYNTF